MLKITPYPFLKTIIHSTRKIKSVQIVWF